MWRLAQFVTISNLKNVNDTHGGVLLLVKLRASVENS